MRLAHRVEKLERTAPIVLSAMEWFDVAMNDAARRLTGNDGVDLEGTAFDLVMRDVEESAQKLSSAERRRMIAELGWLAVGDDTAAMEAARREALSSLDAERG